MAKVEIKGAIVPTNDGWIYDFFGESYTSPQKVADALEDANGEDIDVEINSGGGDVFSASEIYAALRSYKGSVKIHVVGLAASAASVIACAGQSDIAPTAQMMVHNVSTYAAGDFHDMQHAAEMLKQANRSIASAYTTKTGMSEKDVLDLMDAETWITAQDAVDYGLIDEIAGVAKETTAPLALVASSGNLLPATVMDKMRVRRQALVEYFSKEEEES